ncbi:MAG TPA: hypothetical protein DCZ72_15190 [Armatimonadetes bacterium]|nr:hypothetical protein [Armatimonadota bacterium]
MIHRSVSAALLGALLFILTAPPTAAKPYVVRMTLAGELLGGGQGTIADTRSDYLVTHSGDCDGAQLTLLLSPPRSGLTWDPDRQAPLPRLRSGTGVNIGESPRTVIRKLGRQPDEIGHLEWYARGTTTYTYHAKINYRGGPRVYTKYRAEYTFRSGRLYSIMYIISTEHGCDG